MTARRFCRLCHTRPSLAGGLVCDTCASRVRALLTLAAQPILSLDQGAPPCPTTDP